MFVYQIGKSTFNLFQPQVADTSENLLLQDMDLPLITICPQDQANETKVKDLGFSPLFGFNYAAGFLMGLKSANGSSKLSWGADMNMSYDQLLEYVLDGNADLAVNKIKDGFFNNFYTIDLKKKFYIGFSGFCWELEHYDITSKLSILSLSEKPLEVFITDKNIKSYFSLNIDSQLGHKIVSNEKGTVWYVIDVMIKNNQDPRTSGGCVHYEQDEFENCIDEKVQNWIKPDIGCNPPWLSKKDQCNNKSISRTEGYFGHAMQIMHHEDSTFENVCAKPCIERKFNARIRTFGQTDKQIKISFNPNVHYSGKIVTYNFTNFLIDFGSSLGLWFGLSVIGLMDLGVLIVNFFKSKKFIKF